MPGSTAKAGRDAVAPEGARRRPRSRSLAFYLGCYLAAAVVPLLGTIVLIGSQYISLKRTQTESFAKFALDDIRDDLDRDMAAKIATLRALATSPALEAGDFAAFYRQARSLMEPEDVSIILRDAQLRQIVNTRLPPGEKPLDSHDGSPTGDVFTTQQPYVSDLYVAEHSNAPRVSVTVPVLIEGRVVYALSVSFTLSHFTDLLTDKTLPAGYYASITDRSGRIVSRTQSGDQFVGKKLPGFDKAVGPSGRWSGRNPQGIAVMGFYYRSNLSHWLFSIGVEQATVNGPVYDSLLILALLCGALGLVGSALTLAVRRSLVAAFARLGALAGGARDPTAPISTRVSEIDFVGEALGRAFSDLNRQAKELEATKADLETKVQDRTRQLSESTAELAETKRFLDTIVENVPIAIVVKDQVTGAYVLVNRNYEDYMGLPRERMIGKTVHDLYDADVAALLDTFDRDACAPGASAVVDEFTTRRPNQGERFVSTTRIAVTGSHQKPLLIVIIEDITKRRLSEQKIAYLAHHDTLTGLANRTAFLDRIGDALAGVAAGLGGFALHLIDLDRFKEINDSLGHQTGDLLLAEIASRLRSQLRPDDVCARIGGDEFAIVQANVSPAEASDLAARIGVVLSEPIDIGRARIEARASIGVAVAPEHGTTTTDLMTCADFALYRAKSLGRGRHVVFAKELGDAAAEKRATEQELRQAIAERQFEVHYQPIFETRSGAICAVEALVRWRHPSRGLVAPNAFIPLAEEVGLISAIGAQVIETACLAASRWPDRVRLCVNISPRQFDGDAVVAMVEHALAASGLAPERLELEITETAVLGHAAHLTTLEKLRALGVFISLDDFGTGFTSLSQLTEFRFDRIKIDRCFTQNITHSSAASAIVIAVQTLANALGMSTVAEGVETDEQFELLRIAGVTCVQGFLLARPMPADQLEFDRKAALRRHAANG